MPKRVTSNVKHAGLGNYDEQKRTRKNNQWIARCHRKTSNTSNNLQVYRIWFGESYTLTEVQCNCPECGAEFEIEVEPSDYINDRD